MMSPLGVITGMLTQISHSDLIFIWMEYELACNNLHTLLRHRKIFERFIIRSHATNRMLNNVFLGSL